MNIHKQIEDADRHIRDGEKAVNELQEASRYRPGIVQGSEVELAAKILDGWKVHRASLGNHPELREESRHKELLKATGRLEQVE